MRFPWKLSLRAGVATILAAPLIAAGVPAQAASYAPLAIGIKTSDVAYAGTDDDVLLQVYTSNGMSCDIPPTKLDHPGKDDFERNTYTYFLLDIGGCSPGKDVVGVKIWAKSSSPDWSIDYIDTRLRGTFRRWDTFPVKGIRDTRNTYQSGPHYWVNNPGVSPVMVPFFGQWHTLASGDTWNRAPFARPSRP